MSRRLLQVGVVDKILSRALCTRSSFRVMSDQRPPTTCLILDFDGTITKKDTIDIILKHALAFQKARGKDLTKGYERVIDEYLKSRKEHIDAYQPAKDERRSLAEEKAFQRSLRDVEIKSFRRVENEHLFDDIEAEFWTGLVNGIMADKLVVIREGFSTLLNELERRHGRWGIVSVNFSSDFIKAVVGTERSNKLLNVLSNRFVKGKFEDQMLLHEDSSSESTRPGKQLVLTCGDKATLVRKMSHAWLAKEEITRSGQKTVYVGDSVTDIECLTDSGIVGIAIAEGGKSDLIDTLLRLQVKVDHISRYSEYSDKICYWASDFYEIRNSHLFGQM